MRCRGAQQRRQPDAAYFFFVSLSFSRISHRVTLSVPPRSSYCFSTEYYMYFCMYLRMYTVYYSAVIIAINT